MIQALRAEDVFDFESIISLDAVKALSGTAHHTLLTLTSSGDIAGYTAWHGVHSAELESIGVSHEALLTKLRLITLATLCAVTPSLSFAQVASTLAVPLEAVEDWVIDGENMRPSHA